MDNNQKEHPERPLECTECKRPITVHYTEIVGDISKNTGMCDICPVLQRKLQGEKPEKSSKVSKSEMAGLTCGECGTTLDTIRMGNLAGCSVCYDVFGDALFSELIVTEKVPLSSRDKGKSVPLHIGRSPGETLEISPSLRLLALNEALDETLQREDYEQAAWLRDQIKALTEETEDTDDKQG